MPTYPKLELDTAYHIFNRGNNREDIFRTAEDCHVFLSQCHQRLPAFAFLFAYCLLENHFHLALHTFSEEDQKRVWEADQQKDVLQTQEPFLLIEPSDQMRSFFSSYAMRFNHRYHRTGALFERPFERRMVDNDDYLRKLIVYIHRNPETHGLIDDFRHWPYSSYQHYLLPDPDPAHAFILDLFGGAEEFRIAHLCEPEVPLVPTELLLPPPQPALAAS